MYPNRLLYSKEWSIKALFSVDYSIKKAQKKEYQLFFKKENLISKEYDINTQFLFNNILHIINDAYLIY